MTKIHVTLSFHRDNSVSQLDLDESYNHTFSVDDDATCVKVLENVEVMLRAMGYVFDRSRIGLIQDEEEEMPDNVIKI